MQHIAEGLEYLHNQNIIHHDLHSGNILCENEDDVVITSGSQVIYVHRDAYCI